MAHFNLTHLRRQSFYALPQAQWQLLAAPPISYLDTLIKVDEAIEHNAELARAIVRCGLRSFGLLGTGSSDDAGHGGNAGDMANRPPEMPKEWTGVARHGDIDKARSTLRQFYRDWTAEGAAEREASHGPVIRTLDRERERRRRQRLTRERLQPPEAEKEHQDGKTSGEQVPGGRDDVNVGDDEEKPMRVLVPGAGLGRLVFELCLRGYEVEGNEISYHQLLASSYVLNSCPGVACHTLYPWIHTFSNHATRARHLQGYPVPDVHPQTALAEAAAAAAEGKRRKVGSMSMFAADFLCLYSDADHAAKYDAVAAVFFLDTAPNLLRYLDVIRHCLRPGGLLINVGPLLWHFENNAPGHYGRDIDGDGDHDPSSSSGIADPGSFELADDEVMALVRMMGFVVEERTADVRAPYIQDAESMLQTVYRATFWVARKPFDAEAGAVDVTNGTGVTS